MLCGHTWVCLVSGILHWYSCTLLVRGTFTFSDSTLLSFRERQIGNCGYSPLSAQGRDHVRKGRVLTPHHFLALPARPHVPVSLHTGLSITSQS